MIKLIFHCSDCQVHISYWSNEVEIDQVDECPFCGSDSCQVYLSDVMPTSETDFIDDVVARVADALSYESAEE